MENCGAARKYILLDLVGIRALGCVDVDGTGAWLCFVICDGGNHPKKKLPCILKFYLTCANPRSQKKILVTGSVGTISSHLCTTDFVCRRVYTHISNPICVAMDTILVLVEVGGGFDCSGRVRPVGLCTPRKVFKRTKCFSD